MNKLSLFLQGLSYTISIQISALKNVSKQLQKGEDDKMKFRLDLKGIVFEYEKKPMPENRFKALCWIFESALYVIALKAVIVSCGFLGLITTLFLTFMVVGMKEI